MRAHDMRKIMLALAALVLLAGMLTVLGCTGDDDVFFMFTGRDAATADLGNRSFTFEFVANGIAFDLSLENQPTILELGQFDAMNTAPFSLQASGLTATGNATLDQSILTLTFLQVDPGLPFTAGQNIQLEAQVDIDDDRLEVTNTETGASTTSAPD